MNYIGNTTFIINKMKKATINFIGLVLIGFLYYLFLMPVILGEANRFPLNWAMFGLMVVHAIALPLISFIIPGIIAINVYVDKKIFWKNFYYTGWIIYILILIIYSFVICNLKYMN